MVPTQADKIATNLTKAHDLSWDERSEAVALFAAIDDRGANAVSGRDVLDYFRNFARDARSPTPLVRLLASLGPNSDLNEGNTLDLQDFLTWVGDLKHADTTEFSERNRLLTWRNEPSPMKRNASFYAARSCKYAPPPVPEDVDWADMVDMLPLATASERQNFDVAANGHAAAALLHRGSNGGDSLLHYCAHAGDARALEILLRHEPLRGAVGAVNDVGLHACALARDAECERLLRPWLNYSIQKAEANPKLRADKADGSAAAAYRLRLHRAAKKAVSAGKLFRGNS